MIDRPRSLLRKRVAKITIVVVIAFTLVCVDFERPFLNPLPNDTNPIGSPGDLIQKLAEQIDPKRPYSLKELVEGLMNVTPIGTPDLDNDGLPDPVEDIIGTDYNSTDTDFDTLSDYFEVFHDSDPLEPDTNFDGFPDRYEFNVTTSDPDQDGLSNVWDPDNDGDSVNDIVDVSPFAMSVSTDTYHMDIQADGGPLYVDFQFRPTNPKHLLIYNQIWNWPHDEEGLMRDYDGSLEDVSTELMLRVEANVELNQTEVEEYGMLVFDGGFFVPVLPVWDKDDIVAFAAKIFLPLESPTLISLDIQPEWRIIGNSDYEVHALEATTGFFVSVNNDGTLTLDATNETCTKFGIVDLGDDKIALRFLNGQYLSIDDSSNLCVGGLEIGERETFTLDIEHGVSFKLKSYDDRYVITNAENKLSLAIIDETPVDSENSTEPEMQLILSLASQGYESESTLLVSYPDTFYCTGFNVEEFQGSDLGIFYGTSLNHTIATNMVLTERFMRNNSIHVSNVGSLLPPYGIVISNPHWEFSHRDDALVTMANELLPDILEGMTPNKSVPIILTTEDWSKVIEMSQTDSGFVQPATCSIDLTLEPLAIVKSMKTNFYNTSDYNALAITDVFQDIGAWGLDDNGTIVAMSMLMIWNSGEQVVSGEGKYEVDFAPPSSFVLDHVPQITTSVIVLSMMISAKAGQLGGSAFRELSVTMSKVGKFFSLLKGGKGIKEAFKTIRAIQSAFKAGDAAPKFWSKFDIGLAIIGILIDIGFSIYGGIALASEIGGKFGVEVGAVYGTVSAFFAITFGILILAIGLQFPVLGLILGLIYALGAIFGNWLGQLAAKITEAFIGPPHITCEVEPYFDIVETDVEIHDIDGLGLNVGDAIDFTAQLIAGLNATGDEWEYINRSFNMAWLTTIMPSGSSSTNTSIYSYDYPEPADGLPDIYEGYTTYSDTSGFHYVDNYCDSNLTVTPGTPMVNFPINIRFNHYTRLTTRWYHRPFWLFGDRCYHFDETYLSNSSDFTTLYFDVFPSTIDGFINWRAITPLDHDGDGLKDTQEGTTDPWNYDSDSDGLSDKYEINNDLDPMRFDSDFDGLSDEWEVVYGTDPHSADSDGDGLRDYRELAGWEVSFEYNNTPFTIHVFSDPRTSHSDNDSINDYWEYWSNTNPRSMDTNGDGTQDEIRLMAQTELELERSWGGNETYDTWSPELAIDDDDDLYLLETDAAPNLYSASYFENPAITYWAIRKFSSDFDEYTTGSHFNPLAGGHPDYYRSLAVDSSNEHVYSSSTEAAPAYVDEFVQCNLTGTSGTVIDPSPSNSFGWVFVRGMDVGLDGYLYTVEYKQTEGGGWTVAEYSYSGGTLSSRTQYWTIQDLETAVGDLGFSFRDIVYDERSGLVFVVGGLRVLALDPTGVKDPFVFEGTFGDPRGICVDDDGFIYVLDGAVGACDITAYDSNGEKFPFFGDNGTIALNPFFDGLGDDIAYDLVIDSIGNFYVCGTNETWDESTGWEDLPMLLKFNPLQEAVSDYVDPDEDSDFDQLTNSFELASWEITITFDNGTQSFNVTSNPLMNDTDKDTISDYDEWVLGTNPNMPDSDGDSVPDNIEIDEGLDPTNFDSDQDSLPDGIERTFGSNPKSNDTDGDGVPDYVEFSLGSNANNSDSDGDGMNDKDEFDFNSNLTSADSDGDFMFDFMENRTGSNPNDPDDDADGVKDGLELLYSTDPKSNDTDHDGIIDGIEIALWLNPLSADTDNDGLSDLEELEQGTNPWCSDSDFDGIPDGLDEDSYLEFNIDIVLVLNQDVDNQTLEFVEQLRSRSNLTLVSYADFLENYTTSENVVLVGRPSEGSESVSGLVYDLLEDCGDILTDMAAPDSHDMVVRYGIWSSTQTVVMLSSAITFDVYSVLGVFRGSNVSVFTDGINIDFTVAPSDPNNLDLTILAIGGIDIVKRTDCTLVIRLSSSDPPSVTIRSYDSLTTPVQLDHITGLSWDEEALGKYLDISVSINEVPVSEVEETLIILYYKQSELDGLNFVESSLVLYLYNESTGNWIRLSEELDWVSQVGINTTDIEIYGESYSGYLWAKVTHLSLFAVAGNVQLLTSAQVLIIAFGIGGVAITSVFVVRRRRRGAGIVPAEESKVVTRKKKVTKKKAQSSEKTKKPKKKTTQSSKKAKKPK